MKSKLIFVLLVCLLLAGCSEEKVNLPASMETAGKETEASSSPSKDTTEASVNVESISLDTSNMFSDRDLGGDYTESECANIQLNGSSAVSDTNAVTVSGSTVTITDEGTYLLSGSLDGMVIVNAEKADKVQLVLDGVTIHCESSAAIYVLQADKVFITLAQGSENMLSGGESYVAIDENNIDSVIFSKEDLTLNGTGALTIRSPAGHGIVSKDDLVITGGTYAITAASHGISGKDSVRIADGSFTVTAGKDGIHAENDEDTTLGYGYLAGGTYTIAADGDGISALSCLQIDGGSYTVTAGGGSANGQTHTDSMMGGGMGGMGGGMGGGRPGGPGARSTVKSSISSSADTTSTKALKATGELLITDGDFNLDSADDAVHSNLNITVNGGNFTIATGDDGFHADETLTISAGTVKISESYEGLEALHIVLLGGDIDLVSTDDGLNAAGGTDSSGFGGMHGNDMFGGSSSSNGTIEISGGTLYMNASGDGIDANGTLTVSGGYVTVCGPTQGDTAVLDYDISATITGGTFIGTGSYMMAQTFSASEQGVVAVSVGNQTAGTQITLTDAEGNLILSDQPELSFAIVILSSPDITKGESYTITVGSQSGTFNAS